MQSSAPEARGQRTGRDGINAANVKHVTSGDFLCSAVFMMQSYGLQLSVWENTRNEAYVRVYTLKHELIMA